MAAWQCAPWAFSELEMNSVVALNHNRRLFLQTQTGRVRRELMIAMLDAGNSNVDALQTTLGAQHTKEALCTRISELRCAGLLSTAGRTPGISGHKLYALTKKGVDVARLLAEYRRLDAQMAELTKTLFSGA
jgi:hypothetical protein